MKNKKTVLILCDWFLPGYLAGGPIRSIANLTQELEDIYNFKIITTDRDFKSTSPYENIKVNEWTSTKGRSVFYLSPTKLNGKFILHLISNTPHDILYLNSMFSFPFTIRPLIWKKYKKINSSIILAPRGMLGDGAMKIKPIKKKLFIMTGKLLGWFNKIIWHSTSKHETKDIKKRISEKLILFEAPNFTSSILNFTPIEKSPGELKLCFVSRITSKKNLLYAINTLDKIQKTKITLNIYGPIEDVDYCNACIKAAEKLPTSVQMNFKGSFKSEEITKIVSEHHALFLPTLNENYGHVIVETLQCGRPVIISDQTPWRNLEIEKAGFDIPLGNQEKYIRSILELAEMTQSKFNEICSSSALYIQEKIDKKSIIHNYKELFSFIEP